MPVRAPEVAAPQRDAVPVQKFENLNRNLATAAGAIAELGSCELPVMLDCQTADDLDDFRERHAQEEVVVRDLMHFPDTAG